MKKLIMALILMSMVMLNGCDKRTEVRDRAFIHALGIDNNLSSQSVYIRLFSSKSKAESPVLSGTGKTLMNAIENAESTQGKNLFTGHMGLIAVSGKNIADSLTTLIQNNRISSSCCVIYSPKNVEDIIQNTDSVSLKEEINILESKGRIIHCTISDVIDDMMSLSGTSAIPLTDDGKTFTIAVIDNNGIVGKLNENESLGLRLIKEEISDIVLPVESNGKNVSFHIVKTKPHIKAEIIDNTPVINISLDVYGNTIDGDGDPDDIRNTIENLCSSAAELTIHDFNSDVIDLEKIILQSDSKFYKENKDNWSNVLKNARLNYDIKIK